MNNLLAYSDVDKPSLHNNFKRVFDPNNRKDMQVYKNFLETYSWGQEPCPFFLEWPWLSIPDMINYKITRNALDQV